MGLILGAIAGTALGICLVLYYGLDEIGDAFLTAGWRGILAITAIHVMTLILRSLAWRVLLVGAAPPHPNLLFYWARWLRDSIANLLGIVPCAGEVAAARELTWRGVPPGMAGATTVVDLTTELLSQLLFTLLGILVLLAERREAHTTWWAGAGLVVSTIVMVSFVAAQRNGLFQLFETLPARLGLQTWTRPSEAETVHAAVQKIYAYRGRVAISVVLQLAAWIAGTAEALVALRLMGLSLPVIDVIALEALVYALRTVAFIVPSAAGVQEGGYVLIGAIFGVGPDVALALSLLKRAREIIMGAPALFRSHALPM